jgi:uncharacterized alpha-E superfamily protein
VLHALTEAEEALRALDPGDADRSGTGDPARRPIGQLRTRLEYADPGQIEADLPDLVESLQAACRQANEAITKRYFAYSAPVAWAQEG